METNKNKKMEKVPEACPHCGQKLSPWQQVLLGVDRALTCKSCWYRIYLDPSVEEQDQKNSDEEKKFED